MIHEVIIFAWFIGIVLLNVILAAVVNEFERRSK